MNYKLAYNSYNIILCLFLCVEYQNKTERQSQGLCNVNIENERRNFFPNGTTPKIYRIEKRQDLQKLKLNGQLQTMVLPPNFLEYNIPHLRKVHEELVSEIKDSSEEEINYVAGSKIGLKTLFRSNTNNHVSNQNGASIPTGNAFWLNAAKSSDRKDIKVEEMKVGYNEMLNKAHGLCKWGVSRDATAAFASMLTTLTCFPQSPHHDYLLTSNVKMGDEKTMIFAISDAGTYLVVWKEDDNGCLQPMILWIDFRRNYFW